MMDPQVMDPLDMDPLDMDTLGCIIWLLKTQSGELISENLSAQGMKICHV